MTRGSDHVSGTDSAAASAGAEQLTAFQYLTAEKAGLYRAVMRQFVQAKSQFKLHLRPGQIAAAPEVVALPGPIDRVELERALQQLCEWGNLEKHLDTVEVSSVREFLRPRFLYQITATGDAVERALQVFEEAIAETGELQARRIDCGGPRLGCRRRGTSALTKIRSRRGNSRRCVRWIIA